MRSQIQGLSEKYNTTIDFYGKKAEVYKNPSLGELKAMGSATTGTRAFLVGKDSLVWHGVVHQVVREKMKLSKDALPVILYIGGGTVDVMVTDNSRGSKWDRNPKTFDFIKKNTYLKRWKIGEILYYNQDIVGKWHEETD